MFGGLVLKTIMAEHPHHPGRDDDVKHIKLYAGEIHLHHHHHHDPELAQALSDLRRGQQLIHNQGERIMSAIDDANAALKKIDDATTEQGEALAQEAASLQNISDDMDRLLAAAAGGTLTPELLADLQAKADHVAAVSATVKANAEFSKAVAAKVADPVPVPVPEPTEEPTA